MEAMTTQYAVELGKYLTYDGSMWIVNEIIPEGNSLFRWLKVLVSWSGIGPRPLWATEPRTFLLNRHRLTPA